MSNPVRFTLSVSIVTLPLSVSAISCSLAYTAVSATNAPTIASPRRFGLMAFLIPDLHNQSRTSRIRNDRDGVAEVHSLGSGLMAPRPLGRLLVDVAQIPFPVELLGWFCDVPFDGLDSAWGE